MHGNDEGGAARISPESPPQSPTPILPRILEVKRTLSGREKQFECAVLRRDGSHLIVLFVAPTAMHVHGVDLPAGTVTFGHFWSDRPYNVYHWLDPVSGTTLGIYVNLSADTIIANDRLDWRDLAVDILLSPNGNATVLDEDEIPPDASEALRARIADAQTVVLGHTSALIIELERHRVALWPPPLDMATGRQAGP